MSALKLGKGQRRNRRHRIACAHEAATLRWIPTPREAFFAELAAALVDWFLSKLAAELDTIPVGKREVSP